MLMWVVDGDGRDLNGFNSVDPWKAIDDDSGDRHSPSLVSKRHPYLFACFACWDDFRFNPGLILRPSKATIDRIMCMYHQDLGSFRFTCEDRGRNANGCLPGCAWDPCGENPWFRTWECSWRPNKLKSMMENHDGLGQFYFGPIQGDGVVQVYNEVVLDAYTMPWEPDLGSIVEAVFVQARGFPGSTENGRKLHQSVLLATNKTATEIPLLQYDPSKQSNPFTTIWT